MPAAEYERQFTTLAERMMLSGGVHDDGFNTGSARGSAGFGRVGKHFGFLAGTRDPMAVALYACTRCSLRGCNDWRQLIKRKNHTPECGADEQRWGNFLEPGRAQFCFWHEGEPLMPTTELVTNNRLWPDYDDGAAAVRSTHALPRAIHLATCTLALPA